MNRPTVAQIMEQLAAKGSEQTRKTFRNHGAPEAMFGVKVGDLKPIAKQLKGCQDLALGLYATGNSDAMYLAGLVATGKQMSRETLDQWARQATWYMISEYTVPGVAAESPMARDLAMAWIDDSQESVAACGWTTYSLMVAVTPDEELDFSQIRRLLKRIVASIHKSPNRARYAMNNFVISVGAYVAPLLADAEKAAELIGKVSVDMGKTSCKVPVATDAIAKIVSLGRVGKKRNSTKC